VSESTNLVEQVQNEVREIAAPLVSRYEQIKSDIDRRETELDGLRKARTQLAKVIRGIDPDLIEPTTYAKKNGKKKGSGVEATRLAAFSQWLRDHADEVNAMNDGQGFHAGGLFRTYGRSELGLPDSTTSLAIKALHEQGFLRLNGTGNGGAKFYKVITPTR